MWQPNLDLRVVSSLYFKTFLCTEKAVQRVKCEKTAEQAVLKVEVKTEVEEDSDKLEKKVSFFFKKIVAFGVEALSSS
jgi:predicted RNA-binding protein Jag